MEPNPERTPNVFCLRCDYALETMLPTISRSDILDLSGELKRELIAHHIATQNENRLWGHNGFLVRLSDGSEGRIYVKSAYAKYTLNSNYDIWHSCHAPY
jgi:hypothetical protein